MDTRSLKKASTSPGAARFMLTAWVPGSTHVPPPAPREPIDGLPWDTKHTPSRLPLGACANEAENVEAGRNAGLASCLPRATRSDRKRLETSVAVPQILSADAPEGELDEQDRLTRPAVGMIPVVKTRGASRLNGPLPVMPTPTYRPTVHRLRRSKSCSPTNGEGGAVDISPEDIAGLSHIRDSRRHFLESPQAIARAQMRLRPLSVPVAPPTSTPEPTRPVPEGSGSLHASGSFSGDVVLESSFRRARVPPVPGVLGKAPTPIASIQKVGDGVAPTRGEPKKEEDSSTPSSILDKVARTLFFTCHCRRPVGDVPLCRHSDLFLRVRRWASTMQCTVVDAEAQAWATLIAEAARSRPVVNATATPLLAFRATGGSLASARPTNSITQPPSKMMASTTSVGPSPRSTNGSPLAPSDIPAAGRRSPATSRSGATAATTPSPRYLNGIRS